MPPFKDEHVLVSDPPIGNAQVIHSAIGLHH